MEKTTKKAKFQVGKNPQKKATKEKKPQKYHFGNNHCRNKQTLCTSGWILIFYDTSLIVTRVHTFITKDHRVLEKTLKSSGA